jgi:hypothetical protein
LARGATGRCVPEALVLDLWHRNRYESAVGRLLERTKYPILGGAHLRVDLKPLDRQGPNLEVVMVRLVVSGRARSAISGQGEIRAALHSAGRQIPAIALSGIPS